MFTMAQQNCYKNFKHFMQILNAYTMCEIYFNMWIQFIILKKQQSN